MEEWSLRGIYMSRVARERAAPALRSVRGDLCIVMVCTDMSIAEQIGWQLSEVNSVSLITYQQAESMMHNAPAGKVILVVLAETHSPSVLGQRLTWLRNRWPHCPVVVVGDRGSGPLEISARQGGALFLTPPVAPETWSAMVEHVLAAGSRSDKLRERSAAGDWQSDRAVGSQPRPRSLREDG